MTQTGSTSIAAIKPSMEYAKLRMTMRLGNARYSARPLSWISHTQSGVARIVGHHGPFRPR